jgi:hypothetical protein
MATCSLVDSVFVNADNNKFVVTLGTAVNSPIFAFYSLGRLNIWGVG